MTRGEIDTVKKKKDSEQRIPSLDKSPPITYLSLKSQYYCCTIVFSVFTPDAKSCWKMLVVHLEELGLQKRE